jgi:hypothetical protein
MTAALRPRPVPGLGAAAIGPAEEALVLDVLRRFGDTRHQGLLGSAEWLHLQGRTEQAQRVERLAQGVMLQPPGVLRRAGQKASLGVLTHGGRAATRPPRAAPAPCG